MLQALVVEGSVLRIWMMNNSPEKYMVSINLVEDSLYRKTSFVCRFIKEVWTNAYNLCPFWPMLIEIQT